jgi:hypothetical protein
MEPEKPVMAVDPNLAAEQQQAQQKLVANLQTEAQIDTANVMSRFGTRLALASSGMAPMAAPTAAVPTRSTAGITTPWQAAAALWPAGR